MKRVDVVKMNQLVEQGVILKKEHKTLPLDLYVYGTKRLFGKDGWSDEEIQSRGLIIDRNTGEVVAKPFPKFFNLMERSADDQERILKSDHFIVQEKLDGSLGIIFNYQNKWHVATKGSFNSEQALLAEKMLKDSYDLSSVSPETTLLTEIIHPENRIIVNYGSDEKMVLLGAYDRKSGDEINNLNQFSKCGFEVVNEYQFNTLDEVIDYVKTLSENEEGFVIKLADGDRVKIKSPKYIEVFKLMNGFTPKKVWEELDERGLIDLAKFNDLPEEFKIDVEQIAKQLECEYYSVKEKVKQVFYQIITQHFDGVVPENKKDWFTCNDKFDGISFNNKKIIDLVYLWDEAKLHNAIKNEIKPVNKAMNTSVDTTTTNINKNKCIKR